MKILLIHSYDEKNLLEALRFPLAKKGVEVETFPVQLGEDTGIDAEKMTEAFFEQSKERLKAPTHILIISSIAPALVDFLAGVSCGSNVPFIVFGKGAAKAVPKVYHFFFKFFNTEEELNEYLNVEYEIHKKMDTERGANAARDALLEMGIPVTEKSFAQCVCDGDLREVLLFLAAGFSPDTRNKEGVPLVNLAAREGNRLLLRFLAQAGARLDSQSGDRGTSALIDSVICARYDLVLDIIKAGADLNVKSKDGQTALVVAAGAGKADIVEALLKAGADPDLPDSMGMSARKYATLFRNEALISIFNEYPTKLEI